VKILVRRERDWRNSLEEEEEEEEDPMANSESFFFLFQLSAIGE